MLDQYPDIADYIRVDVLCRAGHLAQSLNRPDARDYVEEALPLARAAGYLQREADALACLAILAEDHGEYAAAEAGLRDAREHYIQTADTWAALAVGYHLGVVAYGTGDLAGATTMFQSALAAAEEIGDHLLPDWCRDYLALIACDQGAG